MGLLAELLGFGIASLFVVGLLSVPLFLYWVLERDTEFGSADERRRSRALVGVGALLAFLGMEFLVATMLWNLDQVLPLGLSGSLFVGTGAVLVAPVPAFVGYWFLLQARE